MVAGPIGAAIGAAIGAVGGAIAGSLNKTDPENLNFNQAVALWQANPNNVYAIGNKYLPLAGLFDLSLSNPHIPIYQKYGRMGEAKFVVDLVNKVYQAAQSGQITANDTVLTIMSRIVQPWIDSWGFGPMVDPHADMIQRLIVGLIADYVSGNQGSWRATGGDYPPQFASLPAFSLPTAAAAPTPTSSTTPAPVPIPVPAPLPVTPVGSAAPSSAVLSPNGAYLVAGTPNTITTPQGVFVLSATGQITQNGTNSAQTPLATGGIGTLGVLYYGGQTYAYNSDGKTYVFIANQGGWVQSTQVPAWTPPGTSPSAVPPPASGSVLTSPAVGSTVSIVPDMGKAGLATQVPSGLVFAGLDPLNNSWILNSGGQSYVLWQGTIVPYQAGMFAPAAVAPVGSSTIPQVTTTSPSQTVATTSSGAAVTQADLQALVSQLASQGQTAQQAYTSALQTLQANGIAATAGVQSAVQSAVQSTPAPTTTTTTAGLSGVGWAGVIAAGALLFATARPVGTPKRRRKRHP
jgi:hypothetical protein